MSTWLGTLTLTATDTTFSDVPNEGARAVVIGNESPYTCILTMEGGNVRKTLYPGMADWYAILPGFTGRVLVHVISILNAATIAAWPSSALVFDSMGPGDPEQPSNYPITFSRGVSIGGTVTTTSVNTLTNENNAVGTEVIDIGTAANNKLVDIFNDHFALNVEQGGTKHTALQGKTSGNPLQIGQSGDTSECLGNWLVDGTETVTGDATFNGAGTGLAVTNNATVGGTQTVTGATTLNGGLTSTGGAQTITGNAAGALHIGQSATGDTLDTTATDTFLKSGNTIHFQIPSGTDIVKIGGTSVTLNPNGSTFIQDNGTTEVTIDTRGLVVAKGTSQGVTWGNGNFVPEVSFFTGTTTGTYTHSFNASGETFTPFFCIAMTDTSGSQTMGYDSATTTQVHITSAGGVAFKCMCV